LGVKWYSERERLFRKAQNTLPNPLLHDEIRLASKDTLKWLEKAAERGHAEAQAYLGWINYDNKLYADAFAWYRKAATQGNACGQNSLGDMYENGLGTPKDYEEAAKWYKKAAEQGYAAAQVNLGTMYYNGMSVSQDQAEAVKWFRKAAEQGYADAEWRLGTAYCLGEGVSQDTREGLTWVRKAADQGNAAAQYLLGEMYVTGGFVTQDYAVALDWLKKAAEQGFADAQHRLGSMYREGQGTEKDLAEGHKWYRKAAENGHAESQYQLGLMCLSDEASPANPDEAVKWLTAASKQGHAKAKEKLDEIVDPSKHSADWKKHVNEKTGISFCYPSHWKLATRKGDLPGPMQKRWSDKLLLLCFDPQRPQPLLYILCWKWSQPPKPPFAETAKDLLEQSSRRANCEERSFRTITVAGAEAVEMVCAISDIKIKQVALARNDTLFMVTFSSESASFDSWDQQLFSPILRTISFVGAAKK